MNVQEFTVSIAQSGNSGTLDIGFGGGRVVFLELETPGTVTGTTFNVSIISPNDADLIWVPTTVAGDASGASAKATYRAHDHGYRVPCERPSDASDGLSYNAARVTRLKVDSNDTEAAARDFTVRIGYENP